jgi:hemerythrin
MSEVLPKRLVTGIGDIDEQHRTLLRWARAVQSIDSSASEGAVPLRAAQFLIAYTRYHFDSEEYAMVASGYGALDEHRREHSALRTELAAVSRVLNAHGARSWKSVTSVQKLIQRWIQNHIGASDMSFAAYCEQEPSVKTVQLPSPVELSRSGTKVADSDRVETVHHSGELTMAEIRARLKR